MAGAAAKKTPAQKTAPAKKEAEAEKAEPLTVEEVRERRKAAFEDGTADAPPVTDGDGEVIEREGYTLDDAEPADDDPDEIVAVDPSDPYAGMSRAEIIRALEDAKGNSRFEPPERRATLMYAPRGNCRFYLNGRVCGSWDKGESEQHVWRQIETKCRATGEHEVDVVHWPHKVLPDVLPPEQDLGVRASPRISDVVKAQPKKPGPGGPTTSYQTSQHPVESIG